MSTKRVIFNLARFWPRKAPRNQQVELYEEIKSGRKTSEWRDNTEHWRKRLLKHPAPSRAWFVVGFPKNSLPRLEADIVDIVVHEESGQIEVKFENVEEVKMI